LGALVFKIVDIFIAKTKDILILNTKAATMRLFYLSIIALLLLSFTPKQNNNPFFDAIKKNDTISVVKFIGLGVDLNTVHPYDSLSPICYAIEHNAMGVAKILSNQPEVIKGITANQNPLLMAIEYREPDFAVELINKGADIFLADKNGNQPIHMAAKYKSRAVIELLLSKGADINSKNNDCFTALDFAIISNSKSVIDLVKSYGGQTFKKILPNTIEGPFFEYSDSIIHGYYIKHDAKTAKTYTSDTTFSSIVTVVPGWDGDKAIYDISLSGKSKYNFNKVSKILAVGDTHGEYQRLVNNLIANKVIDKNLNWIYGKSHLVLVGDIFDRGDKVTECLWLIRKLEKQAEEANGMVHFVLGNHESMILRNDIRYVAPKYYSLCYNLGVDFKSIYAQNTFMGRWLRNKNVIIKINDIIFNHAGISQKLVDSKYSIDDINNNITDILYSQSKLEPNNIKLLMSSDGPIWYRGYFKTDSLNVKSILANYSANYIVVGHTEVDTLAAINNYPVIGINIPLWNKRVPNQALLIKKGRFYRVINGVKKEKIKIN